MLLLIASSGLAATVNVGDGDSLYQACQDANNNDIIVVDAGRSLMGSVEDDCFLNGVSDVTIQSSGGSSKVGGILVQSSNGTTLESLDSVGTSTPLFLGAIYLNDSSNVTLRDISISGPATYNDTRFYADDALNLTVDGLSAAGVGSDEAFAELVIQVAKGTSTMQLDGLSASGAGASLQISVTSATKVDLADLVLSGGQTSESASAGCLTLSGGAGGGVFTLTNAQISGCGGRYGGAVHVTSGTATFEGGRIESSQAEKGGGVFIDTEGQVSLKGGVELVDNVATTGSALYVYQSRLTVEGAVLNNNVSVSGSTGAPTGGALTATSPELLDLARMQFCNNSVEGGTGLGSALTVRGGSGGSGQPKLSFAELRANRGGDAVIYLEDHAQVSLESLSIVGNDAETLVHTTTGDGLLLDSSLMMDAKVGHTFPGELGGGYNFWYQVTDPAPEGSLPASDLNTGSGPGLLTGYDSAKCEQPLTLQEGSPLIDAGNPVRDLDPDGTLLDIGANYWDQTPDTGDSGDTGETGETGGDTWETGDSAPLETGDSGVEPLELPIMMSGGCGQSGGSSGVASMLMGLLLLGLKRRAKSPSGDGASHTP
ncbi:MAG: hypothetical protein ACI9VR_000870 [Cognaticolwellia sp.]